MESGCTIVSAVSASPSEATVTASVVVSVSSLPVSHEKAVSVCTDALLYGAYAENMKGRLARMIKKAGRTPTAEELKLIDN